MSIIIKGMDMPKGCIECPMQFGGWCYVSPAEIDERVASTVDEAWEQGKPNWCPLIEIDDEEFDGLIQLFDICKKTSKVKVAIVRTEIIESEE